MTLHELNEKDVIRLSTGENLGKIDDLVFDEHTAKISAVILHGHSRMFGLMGSDEDLEIPWCAIRSIGADVVMVEDKEEPIISPNKQKH